MYVSLVFHAYTLVTVLLHKSSEGGDIYKLSKDKAFKEDVTKFNAASVVMAFEKLPNCMITYRDLKPLSQRSFCHYSGT